MGWFDNALRCSYCIEAGARTVYEQSFDEGDIAYLFRKVGRAFVNAVALRDARLDFSLGDATDGSRFEMERPTISVFTEGCSFFLRDSPFGRQFSEEPLLSVLAWLPRFDGASDYCCMLLHATYPAATTFGEAILRECPSDIELGSET